MNCVNKFFDDVPIYWINLKDSLDRCNNVIEQLKDYPNHIKIEAIDGRDENFFLENYNIKYNNELNFSTSLIAVICSHIKTLKLA